MNISKELLFHYGIISTVLKINNNTILCVPVRKDKEIWTFSSDVINEDNSSQNCLLVINTENDKLECSCSILNIGKNYFECKLLSNNEKVINIINCFDEIETNDEIYGRRKEKRLPIKVDNYKKFGLTSIEQEVYINTIKQSCAIVDVSVHGICFITRFNNSIRKVENFSVKVKFSNFEEIIILKAHKVHVKLNAFNDKIYATYSCQLLEPIHYAWKNQIINMLKNA